MDSRRLRTMSPRLFISLTYTLLIVSTVSVASGPLRDARADLTGEQRSPPIAQNDVDRLGVVNTKAFADWNRRFPGLFPSYFEGDTPKAIQDFFRRNTARLVRIRDIKSIVGSPDGITDFEPMPKAFLDEKEAEAYAVNLSSTFFDRGSPMWAVMRDHSVVRLNDGDRGTIGLSLSYFGPDDIAKGTPTRVREIIRQSFLIHEARHLDCHVKGEVGCLHEKCFNGFDENCDRSGHGPIAYETVFLVLHLLEYEEGTREYTLLKDQIRWSYGRLLPSARNELDRNFAEYLAALNRD